MIFGQHGIEGTFVVADERRPSLRAIVKIIVCDDARERVKAAEARVSAQKGKT